MFSLVRILAVALFVVSSSAAIVPETVEGLAVEVACSSPTVVQTASVPVGNRTVEISTLTCASSQVVSRQSDDSEESAAIEPATIDTLASVTSDSADRHIGIIDWLHTPPLCYLLRTCAPPPPPAPVNVCGVKCTTSCNSAAGTLPPITEDCDLIEDAIKIFQGNSAPTFIAESNSLTTLTSGTCSYFFRNKGSKRLETCWTDLGVVGSSAGSSCFPPVQTIHSEGLCSSSDKQWAIGAAHS